MRTRSCQQTNKSKMFFLYISCSYVGLVVVGGMSQMVLLGSLTHKLVLRLQQVTPGQSLSLVQDTPVAVAVAVVLFASWGLKWVIFV